MLSLRISCEILRRHLYTLFSGIVKRGMTTSSENTTVNFHADERRQS